MGYLNDTLVKFRNDEKWNTPERDGSRRFDDKIAWIENMDGEYASALGMDADRVAEIMENHRNYSWPNYYQPANFPGINGDSVIGVFDTFEAFRDHAKEHWSGFKCPRCGDTTQHPQYCSHRLKEDGKCDWCADGLLKSPNGVIVLEDGLALIPIFDPIQKEAAK